jgi:hypothetical protein
MNRRDLLKLLPGISTVAVIPTISERKEINPNWGWHKDWFYRWSGWICLANQDVMIGRWVAKRPEEPFSFGVYSSYPGGTYRFSLDQMMDTSIKYGQSIPNSETPTETLEEFKAEALRRLIAFIEKHDGELRS